MQIVDASQVPHSLLVPIGGARRNLPIPGLSLAYKFIYVFSKLGDCYLCIVLNERRQLISLPQDDAVNALKLSYPSIKEFYVGGPVDVDNAFMLAKNYKGNIKHVFTNQSFDIVWLNGGIELGAFSCQECIAFFGVLLLSEETMFDLIGSRFYLSKLDDDRDVFRDDGFLRASYCIRPHTADRRKSFA